MKTKKHFEAIGNFLLKKREKQKLTQKELASRLGITSQMVSNWEQGKCGPPNDKLKAIGENLKIQKEDFLFNLLKSREHFYRLSLGMSEKRTLLKKKDIIDTVNQ